MSELASILNPELTSHLQLIPENKLNSSISSLLCDSVFSGCNNQNYWLKKFVVEANDDGAITLSNLDGSTNNLSFKFSGSEWYGGSLIPDPLRLVEKEGGYKQRGKKRSGNKANKSSENGSKNNTKGSNTKDDDVGTNKDAGSSHNNNNKDEGGSNEISITDGDIKGLRLHGYTLKINDGKINDKDKPMYNVSKLGIAKQSADLFRNWGTIAMALHALALEINKEFDEFDIDTANDPYLCWPCCLAFFGRAEADHFYRFDWFLYDWVHVKFLVTDILIVKISLYRIL